MSVRVSLQSVSRTYVMGEQRIPALEEVTLTFEAGSAVAVTGPSGSGKSTMLHVIGAMDVAETGRVVVGEVEVNDLRGARQAAFRRSIGFVFQRFHLLPALTVLDNVLAPVLPFRTDFDKRARAQELLREVGLADRSGSLPARLSGGQQQRVAIARALISRPSLLLADEPTGNLDSDTGADVMDLLVRLRREHGMTLVIATHDPVVAARCDRIVRLRDGRVVDDVPIDAKDAAGELLDRIAGPARE